MDKIKFKIMAHRAITERINRLSRLLKYLEQRLYDLEQDIQEYKKAA